MKKPAKKTRSTVQLKDIKPKKNPKSGVTKPRSNVFAVWTTTGFWGCNQTLAVFGIVSAVSGNRKTIAMKTRTSKTPKQSKLAAKIKDLKPKKDAKGGRADSYYGTGVYKSTDSGRTW
jgi:hypothetical protein